MKMIKARYIAFWATIFIFVACSERVIDPVTPVPESSRSYIFFESEVEDSGTTKASLMTEESPIPSFGVIGYWGSVSLFGAEDGEATDYKYAKGIAEVTYSQTEGYIYNKLAQWQDASTNHNFYAFYPYSLSENVGHKKANAINPYILYTQPTSNDDTMVDLLTTKESISKTSDNIVDLTFHHRLWALDVKITNNQTLSVTSDGDRDENPKITITGVKLIVEQFPVKAYIYLDHDQEAELYKENNIVVLSESTTYTLPLKSEDGDELDKDESEIYGSLLFIPVDNKVFKYKLEITFQDVAGSDTFTSELRTSDVKFEEGKKYILTVSKGNDTFIVGKYEDPDGPTSEDGTSGGEFEIGHWRDVSVTHTFN